jgi:hypothetical protein
VALRAQGKPEEAIAVYREALRLNPDAAYTLANLGLVLRSRGEFDLAVAEFRKALDHVRHRPSLAREVEMELNATERFRSLAARLPAVLAAELKPSDATETLGFARVCSWKELHVASAGLSAQAFQDQPSLAEDMRSGNRYQAACAAARAGSGRSKDASRLDEAAKARWRKRTMEWLTGDLAAWSKLIAAGPPEARQSASQTVQQWKADPNLAGVREQDDLTRLPGSERNDWQALWARVDSLLRAADGQSSNDPPAPPKSSAKPGGS